MTPICLEGKLRSATILPFYELNELTAMEFVGISCGNSSEDKSSNQTLHRLQDNFEYKVENVL